jgi:hypothetical protein
MTFDEQLVAAPRAVGGVLKAAAGRAPDEIDITSLERARRPGQA